MQAKSHQGHGSDDVFGGVPWSRMVAVMLAACGCRLLSSRQMRWRSARTLLRGSEAAGVCWWRAVIAQAGEVPSTP